MTQKYPLPPPPILRNLDNFSPDAFYSTSHTIRHGRVTDINVLESEFLEYQATPDGEFRAYFERHDKLMDTDHT